MTRFTVLFAVCSIGALAQSPRELKYSIVVAGRVAGHETETISGDSVRFEYTYNDRGRGPEVHGTYLFANGMPRTISIAGQDYNHTAIDEQFSPPEDKSAAGRWKSRTESGESATAGFYVAANGPSAQTAWLVRAMLQWGVPMPLLPGGRADYQRGPSLELKGEHVTLYTVSGLDFTPQPVWLDDHNDFFAGSGSFASIRQGFEDFLPKLQAAEREESEKHFHDLASRLAEKPNQPIAIRHVRVFNSETATTLEDQRVVIRGDRIESIAPDRGKGRDSGMRTIQANGWTMLPGLFDMHAHFAAYEGILNIACGVTSVRDLGNDMNRLLRWKQQMDADEMIGPRVVLAGVMDGRGEFTAPTDVLVDTEAEARAAIDKYKANGYIQIKIYSSVKPELVPFITAYAHQNGMRVSGHVPAGMIADQFVDAGVDEFQHINFFFLNFWPEEASQTNTRARLTIPAERAASLDPNSPAVEKFIAKLKAKNIVVDPTVGVFESDYTARPGVASPSYASIVDRLPVQLRRAAFRGGLPAEGDEDRIHRASFQAMLDMTARLYRAGVPLVIGTDGIEGLMLHRELELWVQAGIPPEKVLQLATIGAARVARADQERGTIAPGKLADVALFEGNPVKNISDIRKPRVVIKNGVVYRSESLFTAIGMMP